MTAALARGRPTFAMSEPDKPEWEQVSQLVLAALPSAVNCARMLVHSALLGWQLDRRCVQAAEQATEKLVGHAVTTTGVTEAQPLYRAVFDHLGLLRVRLRLQPTSLVVEVWDSANRPPDPRLGRSLVIGRQLGYDLPFPGKRVVWCVVPTFAQAGPDDRTALPRRVPRPLPRPHPAEPTKAMCDPDLLQRVLDGLRRFDPEAEQEDAC